MGSLHLVTITLTRKMLTMAVSVIAFGHALSTMQWAGVAMVFGAIAAEAFINTQEKKRSETAMGAKKEL